jgi:hypothetical protein
MATSAFGKAFRAARDAGDTEFEFGGKKYNTKMKGEGSAPASKAPSKADMEALEAKGLTNQKTQQDEEEKSSTGPDSASKNLGSAVGSRKVQPDFTLGKTPTSEQASANRAAVADKVKSVAGSIGDYFSNFKTPAERRSDEAKQGSGMKKGGAVSASRRGDGIAQRGKTRGKMC